MAKTKKTIPKKSAGSKSKKSSVPAWSWRFSLLTVAIYTIVVTVIVIVGLLVSGEVAP